MIYRSTTSTENVEAVAFLVNKYETEIASLREQLSTMMAIVASVEKERDELQDLITSVPQIMRNLVAMTKERDELVEALEHLIERADVSNDCRYGTLSTNFVKDICEAALAKVGEKL